MWKRKEEYGERWEEVKRKRKKKQGTLKGGEEGREGKKQKRDRTIREVEGAGKGRKEYGVDKRVEK